MGFFHSFGEGEGGGDVLDFFWNVQGMIRAYNTK